MWFIKFTLSITVKSKRNKSSLLFTGEGAHIQINDVTVAGPQVKKMFNRECETLNSTTATSIMVYIYIYLYIYIR